MRADCEKFDHRGLIERHAFGLVDELRGQIQILRERAIAMNAEHLVFTQQLVLS